MTRPAGLRRHCRSHGMSVVHYSRCPSPPAGQAFGGQTTFLGCLMRVASVIDGQCHLTVSGINFFLVCGGC